MFVHVVHLLSNVALYIVNQPLVQNPAITAKFVHERCTVSKLLSKSE